MATGLGSGTLRYIKRALSLSVLGCPSSFTYFHTQQSRKLCPLHHFPDSPTTSTMLTQSAIEHIVLTIFTALVLVAIEACAEVATVDFTGCGAPHGSEEVHALLAPADRGLYAISNLLSVPLDQIMF